LSVNEVQKLWTECHEISGVRTPFDRPEYLLWALYYLKVYPTWDDQMAIATGVSEKTLRKWVGIVVDYLSTIDHWVSTSRLGSIITLAHKQTQLTPALNNYFYCRLNGRTG
jgi:hypothetical protein